MRMPETQTPHSAAAVSLTLPTQIEPEHKTSPAKPGAKKPIRVLLVDDHPVVRKGLSSFLSNYSEVSIIGEASDGQEALRKARELAPDLLVMDIDMPRMNGLTAADTLRRENPKIKVL